MFFTFIYNMNEKKEKYVGEKKEVKNRKKTI